MERIDKVKGIFEKKVSESDKNPVSVAVIRRLPRYHRYLGELLRDGRLRISSAELSKIMGVTASQIRQDFNCFGGFGQQGYGYNVKYLHGKISELLGITENTLKYHNKNIYGKLGVSSRKQLKEIALRIKKANN